MTFQKKVKCFPYSRPLDKQYLVYLFNCSLTFFLVRIGMVFRLAAANFLITNLTTLLLKQIYIIKLKYICYNSLLYASNVCKLILCLLHQMKNQQPIFLHFVEQDQVPKNDQTKLKFSISILLPFNYYSFQKMLHMNQRALRGEINYRVTKRTIAILKP